MKDEHHQPGSITRLRPFLHLCIARLQIGSSGVPEGSLRPLADEEVDPDGFAGPIVNEKWLRLPHEYRLAICIDVRRCDAGSYELLGRNAIPSRCRRG